MPGLLQTVYPTGRLSISGTSGWMSMHTAAWNVTDLLDLWVEAARRGQNRLLPTAAGVIAYRRRTTATDHLLPIAVCGEVDQAGTPYPDPWMGLETNLEYLYDQIVADPGTVAGTRDATITMPSGVDRSAAIHVLGIERGRALEGVNELTGDAGVVMLGQLAISIPAGRFE